MPAFFVLAAAICACASVIRFKRSDNLERSLSQLAQQVTGTRWNGYHFFGLRKEWPA